MSYEKFEKWYVENERRFHCGQMSEKEIAHSAWEASKTIVQQSLSGSDKSSPKCSHKRISPRKNMKTGDILKFCQDCQEYV